MDIFNPENTTHTLKIIPRFYPDGQITVNLKDEKTKEVTSFTLTPTVTDGYMYIDIEHEFSDNTNFQIEIKSVEDVVYRGKLFVTNQAGDTQAYKISKDIFTYE